MFSGANDGLGLPFLYLPLFLMRYATVGEAVSWWILDIIFYQILLSVVFGIVFGYCGRKVLRLAENYELMDKESFLGFSIALTVRVAVKLIICLSC